MILFVDFDELYILVFLNNSLSNLIISECLKTKSLPIHFWVITIYKNAQVDFSDLRSIILLKYFNVILYSSRRSILFTVVANF